MKKLSLITIGLFLVILLSFSYGKWEYLTIKYGPAFQRIFSEKDSELLCDFAFHPHEVKQLKVMEYSEGQAKIFVQFENNDKFHFFFAKTKNGDWTLKDKNLCRYGILDATEGSAEMLFYWY